MNRHKLGIRLWGVVIIVVALLGAGSLNGASDNSKDTSFKAVVADDGHILIVNNSTGQTLHKIPKPAGVVRETFALEGGAVLAVSQRNFTQFWDAVNGKPTRQFGDRIYAFSHDERSSVTYTANRDLIVHNYPDFSTRYVLARGQAGGPSAVSYSPDDRYLAVQFCDKYPLSDDSYPNPILEKTLFWVKVFDLTTGKQVPSVDGVYMGSFSDDSRQYTTGEGDTFDLVSKRFIDREHHHD